MLGGVPTPLDPFEARRLLFTLLLLSVLADERVVSPDANGVASHGAAPNAGRRTGGRRRHVRPPRSC